MVWFQKPVLECEVIMKQVFNTNASILHLAKLHWSKNRWLDLGVLFPKKP